MSWSRSVAPGMDKYNLQQMNKELATKRVTRTKLKVCLKYLSIENSKKRMFVRGFKRASYPDTNEYFKLIERKRKFAKQIIIK